MVMKYGMMLALAASLGLLPGLVRASEALAKENGCLACHKVERKVVGPAYRDVAKKYRGEAKAAAMLEEKVRKGSKGVWGPAPMPPQTQVSDADLKAIIAWILAQ